MAIIELRKKRCTKGIKPRCIRLCSTNDSVLKNAIDQLPKYVPDNEIWNGIEIDLDLEKGSVSNDSLPQHSPTDFIWYSIEAELHEEKVQAKVTHQTPIAPTRIRRIYLSVAAAAAVVILIISTFFMGTSPTEAIAYSEEWVEEAGADFWEDEDTNEAFEVLTAICADPPVYQNPDFQNLQEELDFLNQSLEEFKVNLSAFGDDETLIAEITELEIERNEVVKLMIDKIL